jgi:hypothetical protein
MSGEWERAPKILNPVWGSADPIPATHLLFNLVNTLLERRRGFYVAARVPGWLSESAQFEDITAQYHIVPIGDWYDEPTMRMLGNNFRSLLVTYGNSLKPLLREPGSGLDDTQVDEMVAGFVNDMHNVSGMVGVYHTVHAKKKI